MLPHERHVRHCFIGLSIYQWVDTYMVMCLEVPSNHMQSKTLSMQKHCCVAALLAAVKECHRFQERADVPAEPLAMEELPLPHPPKAKPDPRECPSTGRLSPPVALVGGQTTQAAYAFHDRGTGIVSGSANRERLRKA